MTSGQRSSAAATPLARPGPQIHNERWARGVVAPAHGKRTARCPSWRVTRQTPHAKAPWVSPRKAGGRVPSPAPFPSAVGDPPAGASPFGSLGLPSFVSAPPPPLLWVSGFPSLPPPRLVRVRFFTTLSLSPPSLPGSFPLLPTAKTNHVKSFGAVIAMQESTHKVPLKS